MDKQKIHYCFILSEEQMEYLRSKKYKIDRMDCFMSLVSLADRKPKTIPISKTMQVELLPGQVMVDNTELAKLWNKDRKTVPKLIEAMESLGISSSQKVGDNRIHTLHSLSGWYVGGNFVQNTFATRRSPDGTAIVRIPVPPAKTIIIDIEETKNVDTDVGTSDDGISHHSAERKDYHHQNSALCPSQSNVCLNEGNFAADKSSSPFPKAVSTHQSYPNQHSAGKSSCCQEADGSQNDDVGCPADKT